MNCVAYFDKKICPEKVKKYGTWCNYHGNILIKIRKDYKCREKKVYDNSEELSDLEKETIEELNKKYQRISKSVAYRKLMTEIGYSPENRDYNHELWIFKMERDLDSIESELNRRYSLPVVLQKPEKTEKTEKTEEPETVKKYIPQKIQKPKKINIKVGDTNFEIDKYGKKTWDEKDIATYIAGFFYTSLTKTISNYLRNKMGEYSDRFYQYVCQYIDTSSFIRCTHLYRKGKIARHGDVHFIYSSECIENAKNLDFKDQWVFASINLYIALKKMDKNIPKPPWILDVFVESGEKSIPIPLDKCLEAAMGNEIMIKTKLIFNEKTTKMDVNMGNVKFSVEEGFVCRCDTQIVVKIDKKYLEADFENIDKKIDKINEHLWDFMIGIKIIF